MKGVELYGRVRYAVQIEGLSHREAARQFGIDPRTVAKMVKFSVPPGYVRKKPPARPKLDPFILVIDGILLDDKSRPKKQQHTAKRIFERLTGALLDRLTHHVHILEMNGDSYRLNQSKRRSRRASADTPADKRTQA